MPAAVQPAIMVKGFWELLYFKVFRVLLLQPLEMESALEFTSQGHPEQFDKSNVF